jgi:hypothetical protein
MSKTVVSVENRGLRVEGKLPPSREEDSVCARVLGIVEDEECTSAVHVLEGLLGWLIDHAADLGFRI